MPEGARFFPKNCIPTLCNGNINHQNRNQNGRGGARTQAHRSMQNLKIPFPHLSHLNFLRSNHHFILQTSPQRVHLASISPPNIPTAPAFCKHISSKHPHSACISQAYLLQTSPQRLHFASISPPNIPTAPAFRKHISSKHPHSACISQAYLLQTSPQRLHLASTSPPNMPQRLHFASISPPNIPTAPAFCKHVSPKIASLPSCKGSSTHAGARRHAISPKIASLPFCKGSINHQNQNQNGRGGARTHTGARKIPKIPFPPSLPTKLPSVKIIISSYKHNRYHHSPLFTPIVLALCLPQCGLKIGRPFQQDL